MSDDRLPPRCRACGAILGVTLPVDLVTHLRDMERDFIAAALAQTNGEKAGAARLLGMRRTTLVEKLRRWRDAGATLTARSPA